MIIKRADGTFEEIDDRLYLDVKEDIRLRFNDEVLNSLRRAYEMGINEKPS